MTWLTDLSIVSAPFLVGVGAVAAMWFGAAVLARHHHVLRWLFGGFGVFCVLLLIGASVNAHFGYVRTLGEAFGGVAGNEVTAGQVDDSCATVPAEGSVTSVTIPATTSGFDAVEAWAYFPPAFCKKDGTKYPVIVMLHGNPGSTKDWINGGKADATSDAFAAQHDGKAPVLIFPDTGGASDTECVDSTEYGKVETYLTTDVPNFIEGWDVVSGRIAAAPDGWAIAGLSMGATCSLMLALRHTDVFHTIGDFAGDYFGVGDGVSQDQQKTQTVPALFGGDTKAYDEHDPTQIMKGADLRALGGWFEAGTEDEPVLDHLKDYATQAQAAGMTVCWKELPGQSHTFDAFASSFEDALPWLAARTGLIEMSGDVAASCGKL